MVIVVVMGIVSVIVVILVIVFVVSRAVPAFSIRERNIAGAFGFLWRVSSTTTAKNKKSTQQATNIQKQVNKITSKQANENSNSYMHISWLMRPVHTNSEENRLNKKKTRKQRRQIHKQANNNNNKHNYNC